MRINLNSRDISIRHFQERRAKFLRPLCTLSAGKLDVGRAFGQERREKFAKIETNIRPRARKKLHSSRKKLNKSCLCFDTTFIQLFNIKFKVRSLKNGHIFFALLLRINFSALMNRKGAKLSTETKELIVTLSESVKTERDCQEC